MMAYLVQIEGVLAEELVFNPNPNPNPNPNFNPVQGSLPQVYLFL